MWVYKVPIRCKKALLNRRLRSVVDMAFNSASSESGAPSCAEVVRCSLRPPSGRIQISFRNRVPLIKCIRSRSLKINVSFSELFSVFFLKNFQLLFNWHNKQQSQVQSDRCKICTNRWRSDQLQLTHIWNPWWNKTDANLEDSACTSYECCFSSQL